MKLLLDTHVFLWALTEPERLGAARADVEDPGNEVLVSAATSWEIAIKHALGRLPLPEPPADYVPDRIRSMGATAVPVEHTHALAVAALPPLHQDPFDRLLVAQADALEATLLTADPQVARYDVATVLLRS